MKKNLIAILSFYFLFLGTINATEIYPRWFLFPKDYPDLITGYTYNSMPAIEDAANMYYAFKECIVVGTLEIYEQDISTELLKNSNYFYYFSPDSVGQLLSRLQPVDRFDISTFTGDQIFAYTIDEAIDPETERIDGTTLPRPEWLNSNFFQDSGYYYGVGMYTAIGNENDAWKTAEEQAIFSILTTLAVEVFKIRIVSKDSDLLSSTATMDEISFLKIKYLLRNIQILERFPDRKNKLFYTLVRIPINGIVSPMLN